LSQKASGVTSEEQVLKKSFKYFDLNNNGTVEPDEFAKAIEKIGIMIPTKQVSITLEPLTVYARMQSHLLHLKRTNLFPVRLNIFKPQIYYYRISMPSSASTMPTPVAHSSTMNSHTPSTADHYLLLLAELDQVSDHPRSFQKLSDLNSFQEAPEDSLDFRDNSRLWTITIPGHSTSTSSPKPCRTTCWDSLREKFKNYSAILISIRVVQLNSMSLSELSEAQ